MNNEDYVKINIFQAINKVHHRQSAQEHFRHQLYRTQSPGVKISIELGSKKGQWSHQR